MKFLGRRHTTDRSSLKCVESFRTRRETFYIFYLNVKKKKKLEKEATKDMEKLRNWKDQTIMYNYHQFSFRFHLAPIVGHVRGVGLSFVHNKHIQPSSTW